LSDRQRDFLEELRQVESLENEDTNKLKDEDLDVVEFDSRGNPTKLVIAELG